MPILSRSAGRFLAADPPFRELLDEAFEQSFRDKGDFTMEFSVRIGRKGKIQ
jgi:hypothetical protein